ncbi:alpha-(1,3)-fucosyltransferase C [Drosophila kikkawai]|uniref:Fucosyltransferase n=1 Tax=Drosophila kikkawai TaxID=30033 RepID=A0A6P4IZM5_DROKI|nr:alpha-(1,3)-fucosyltransferase C [Drosophila kikkawai]XP_041633278.1 alpha-(1,3)-fucosyltransferase C [Drosophila kikkawai]
MDKNIQFPVDKILSLRRISVQTENMEELPNFLPRQLSADTVKRPDKGPLPKGRWMSASGVDLPPPQRSPMSHLNRQRELYSTNQYIIVLKTVVGVIVVCTFLSMIFVSHLGQSGERESSPKVLILLWNEDPSKMFRKPTHSECGCVVTTDRRHLDKPYDAVVFNADLPYSLEDFSEINRTANYLSVFAARNPLSLGQGPGVWPVDNWPFFNLTMTYRLDSQLVWSEFYFSFTNTARRLNSFRAPSEQYGDDMPGSRIQFLESHLQKKDRLAMYLIYEVDEASLPESFYLAELRKFMDLDAFDSCMGPIDCNHYHFWLIFDATACPDYVPPQMYMAMHNFIVPVLIGGGNLTNLVPPESYISSIDFPKPKDLAAHLKYLVKTPEEYQRCFWWHSIYKLRRSSVPYCQLCSFLNQPKEERRIETTSLMNFADWWTKYQCPQRVTTFL